MFGVVAEALRRRLRSVARGSSLARQRLRRSPPRYRLTRWRRWEERRPLRSAASGLKPRVVLLRLLKLRSAAASTSPAARAPSSSLSTTEQRCSSTSRSSTLPVRSSCVLTFLSLLAAEEILQILRTRRWIARARRVPLHSPFSLLASLRRFIPHTPCQPPRSNLTSVTLPQASIPPPTLSRHAFATPRGSILAAHLSATLVAIPKHLPELLFAERASVRAQRIIQA